MSNALGAIETRGLVASIKAANRMVKTANVTLTGQEKIGSGLVTITIRGDVGAVKIAADVGIRVTEGTGEVVSSYVIPRSREEIEKILPGPNSDAE